MRKLKSEKKNPQAKIRSAKKGTGWMKIEIVGDNINVKASLNLTPVGYLALAKSLEEQSKRIAFVPIKEAMKGVLEKLTTKGEVPSKA